MLCAGCHLKLPNNLRFCPNCGQLTSLPIPNFSVSWPTLYNRGCDNFNKGNITKAKIYFSQVIELNSSHQLSWYNLGTILLTENDISQALIHLAMSKQLNAYHIPTQLNLAACYVKQNKLMFAIRELRNILKIDPDNSHALDALAALKKRKNT